MTEIEAKLELFKIHQEYMSHPPKERLELYDKYQEDRKRIKHELAMLKLEKIQEDNKKIR